MKNTLSEIRRQYGVPAKRGQRVRQNHCGRPKEGVIVAASRTHGQYLKVRWEGEKRAVAIYPFDVDYKVSDEWFLGDDYCAVRDQRLEKWNEQMNKGAENGVANDPAG